MGAAFETGSKTHDQVRAGDKSVSSRNSAADRTAGSQRSAAQRQERLAAGLAMVAGFVYAYGVITYGVYVSFMSGNTTQTG